MELAVALQQRKASDKEAAEVLCVLCVNPLSVRAVPRSLTVALYARVRPMGVQTHPFSLPVCVPFACVVRSGMHGGRIVVPALRSLTLGLPLVCLSLSGLRCVRACTRVSVNRL